MKKTPTARQPLPPLPLPLIHEIETIESYANSVLKQCSHGIFFNTEKAARVLRSSVLQVFAKQVQHYASLDGWCIAWQDEIKESALRSMLFLLDQADPLRAADGIKPELRQTLNDYVNGRLELAPSKPAPPKATAPTPEQPICAQLRQLRERSRLTIEELAQRLELDTRSVERHLSGQARPRIAHIGAYERVFTEAIGSKVIIHRTPVERR